MPANQRGSTPYHQRGPDPEPNIHWKHIDGPLLVMRDGQMHWLTLWERLCCALGWHDARSLERKHWDKL